MKTIDINKTDWALLMKYFSGNISEAEKLKVLDWANASEKNKAKFDKAQKIWNKSKEAKLAQINVEKAWSKVNSKAKIKELGKIRILSISPKYLLRIAAVLILGFVSWYFIQNAVSDKSVTATDQLATLMLSDGSEVALNKGAIVNYPEKFAGNTREIEMRGEAFFNISKNPERPFIIHTSKAQIKVLGTSFNVLSKTNGDLEVVVNSGIVSVTSNLTKEQVILHKDEKALLLNINSSLIKTLNTDENYLSWKTHKFVFREKPLDEVFASIEKVYGLKIIADKKILQCKLTATYDSLDIKQIMKMIDLTFGFKTIENNGVYKIEGKSCVEK
jgi:ferric-dicitrate binding protein FerR (iron transport regulator)